MYLHYIYIKLLCRSLYVKVLLDIAMHWKSAQKIGSIAMLKLILWPKYRPALYLRVVWPKRCAICLKRRRVFESHNSTDIFIYDRHKYYNGRNFTSLHQRHKNSQNTIRLFLSFDNDFHRYRSASLTFKMYVRIRI